MIFERRLLSYKKKPFVRDEGTEKVPIFNK